jgi:hypothetical protein
MGVSARRALDTVLGRADQPDDSERRDPDEMREWLLSAPGEPFGDGGDGYEAGARYAARLILEAFLADPVLASAPTETQYDWDADPDHGSQGMRAEYVKAVGLYELLKDRGVPLADLGLTVFQWGWAMNAARYCVELPAAPNPAIIDIEIPDTA